MFSTGVSSPSFTGQDCATYYDEIMNDLVKRACQKFSQSPLRADQQDLYVDLEDVRGEADAVHRIKHKIHLDNQATTQVLAGHRGSGKSTELNQLASQLENENPQFFVVHCKALDIDLHDMDFPDVLVEIVRQLALQLREREQIKLKPGYFEDRWNRLKSALSREVSFDSVKLDAGMATIATTIKGSPDTR